MSGERPTVEEPTIPQLLDELYSWTNDPRAKPWLAKVQKRIATLEAKLQEAERERDEARGQLVDVHGSCDLTLSRLQAENERLRKALKHLAHITKYSDRQAAKFAESVLLSPGGEKGGGRG